MSATCAICGTPIRPGDVKCPVCVDRRERSLSPAVCSALRSCPFCDGEAQLTLTTNDERIATRHTVICLACGASGKWCDSPEAATAAWNERVVPTDLESRLHGALKLSEQGMEIAAKKDLPRQYQYAAGQYDALTAAIKWLREEQKR